MAEPWYSGELLDCTVAELCGRFRGACAHLAPDAFETIFQQMARVQLKFQLR